MSKKLKYTHWKEYALSLLTVLAGIVGIALAGVAVIYLLGFLIKSIGGDTPPDYSNNEDKYCSWWYDTDC